MKVIIMAGGKGTRISSIASDIPKPMIKVAGKPVLEMEINNLREQGFIDIIITVGHLGNVIVDYFGDGSRFGVNIQYYNEVEPLGNAGALYALKNELKDDFFLINGDAIFDIDFNKMLEFHRQCKGKATILTHPNNHPFDSGLIAVDEKCSVTDWFTKEGARPEYYENRVNAGIHIISPELLVGFSEGEKVDLDRQLLKPLAGTGQMFAYDSSEYVKDMGTPERYRQVCFDYERGIVKNKNLRKKQKAIFLDRDGVINKYVGFLRDCDSFELIDGVSEAIKKINESGYLAVVVTNQPVVARGEVTFSELRNIHNKMETLLGNEGAYLDKIYFCPHHPDKGFSGEIEELKKECLCRKPRAGMLLKAAEELNIDLSLSWMIGDSKSDIEAGKNAHCKTALVGEGKFGQDVSCSSLLDFVEKGLFTV